MTIAHGVAVRIAGNWADCWLYKGILHLWDDDGELYKVPVETIVRDIVKTHSPHIATIAEHALFRNDWTASEQQRSLLRSSGYQSYWEGAAREAIEIGPIEYSPSQLRWSGTEPVPGVLLGSSVYANRLFLASTEGLFESRVGPQDVDEVAPLEQLLSVETRDVNANYASVAASAADEGLWFGEVDWADNPTESHLLSGLSKGSLQKKADRSYKTSFAKRNLLNYDGDAVPTLWRADSRQDKQGGEQFASWKIRSIRPGPSLESAVMSASGGARQGNDSLQVLGNSDNNLLLARRGELHVVSLRKQADRFTAEPSKSFNKVSLDIRMSEILSTHSIVGGFVIEQAEGVAVVTGEGVKPLLDGEFAQVRTFARSKSYGSVCAAIDNDACYLIATRKP